MDDETELVGDEPGQPYSLRWHVRRLEADVLRLTETLDSGGSVDPVAVQDLELLADQLIGLCRRLKRKDDDGIEQASG